MDKHKKVTDAAKSAASVAVSGCCTIHFFGTNFSAVAFMQ